jgi:two-component system, OmpR family, KDP operon response regulator KdpE
MKPTRSAVIVTVLSSSPIIQSCPQVLARPQGRFVMMRSYGAKLLILAAGGDPHSLRDLELNLESQGHEVMTASTGHAVLGEIREEMPDLIILDMVMSGFWGPEICGRIRETTPVLPIIILSSSASESDKVVALDLGADDYLTKPFSMGELSARIRAVLRRRTLQHKAPAPAMEVGDFSIERDLRRIRVLGKPIDLTPKEFDILNCLLLNARKVVTHRELLVAVWGPESSEETDYLRVFVSRLRRKIEPDARPRYILTVPWIGYRIEPNG